MQRTWLFLCVCRWSLKNQEKEMPIVTDASWPPSNMRILNTLDGWKLLDLCTESLTSIEICRNGNGNLKSHVIAWTVVVAWRRERMCSSHARNPYIILHLCLVDSTQFPSLWFRQIEQRAGQALNLTFRFKIESIIIMCVNVASLWIFFYISCNLSDLIV